MRGARSVLLDLTADGDVFVPDRRLGRSRRLIDSFFPPFACVAPDQVLYFHLSPSLSPSPFLPFSLSLSSHFHPPCPPSLPAPSHLLLAQSPASSEVRRRHFAPRRLHSCFCWAPINRFTAPLDQPGPASSRHTVVIRSKVASPTDPRSPFVSSLARTARGVWMTA